MAGKTGPSKPGEWSGISPHWLSGGNLLTGNPAYEGGFGLDLGFGSLNFGAGLTAGPQIGDHGYTGGVVPEAFGSATLDVPLMSGPNFGLNFNLFGEGATDLQGMAEGHPHSSYMAGFGLRGTF